MSISRMNDLLCALEADGWKLMSPRGMYEVENEIVNWSIVHLDSGVKHNIDFHLFGDLGEESNLLKDILYCIVRGTTIKLYFEKRESEKWKIAVSEFISALR